MIDSEFVSEMSKLYSTHYGIWGKQSQSPGHPVRLSTDRIREWLTSDSLVVWAEAFGQLIGYAVAIHAHLPGKGYVAWITQFVVHSEHRNKDVGKRLLFTIWGFSDHFAWGLLSANPYAVRALEKATRRRCQPTVILHHVELLKTLGERQVPYMKGRPEVLINSEESRINTVFLLDHSGLPTMISNATKSAPWTLGNLREGWEWFAFTFRDQDQIELDDAELQEMLEASDKVTKHAYARMQTQWSAHPWAKFAPEETDFIIQASGLAPGASILDFGCGDGRHVVEFARRGFQVTGVDYVAASIDKARQSLDSATSGLARFHTGDCTTTEISGKFALGICLYDVVGSYADDRQNVAILMNLSKHIQPGGYVFLSVMNMELTDRIAKHRFSVVSQPDSLLKLPPSNRMERSGDIFDPDFYMIDDDTRVVYRKEQFRKGEELFEELLVRDRRYTEQEIRQMCSGAGLEVVWTRFVRAGHWDEPLERTSDRAKEILVMCRKPVRDDLQQRLFD
jgi:2-polyprenyl-3-methyl-5-hydroxy-6-metoxy-1,4-benzoquinol methylase/GNAT superfamily N-acetyltransferase